MKRKLILIAAALSCLYGCAKVEGNGNNYLGKVFLDSWLKVYGETHPEGYTRLGQGVYYFNDEEIPGTGEDISDIPYLYVEYTSRELDGTITSSTDVATVQRLGQYTATDYHGPLVWKIEEGSQYTGLIQCVTGMKVGGFRSALLPRWMLTTNTYDTDDEYRTNYSGSDNDCIYDIKIVDAFDDVIKWQVDSMEKFNKRHLGGVDSLCYGYYYKQLREPYDTTAYPTDSTTYVNYVGRLLNGQVFDTNIKDTAKVHGIYSTSSTYAPSAVTWDSDSEEYQLGGSSVIDGFAKALALLRRGEKAVVMFSSDYGYGSSSSGTSIPGYSPLIFEIEYVDYEE